MQQTEKYKLNLIERNDPFSPDALNQNTQKVEDAMAAHEAGIEQRLTVLEAHRFYAGTYQGGGFHPLPFTPVAILIVLDGEAFLASSGPEGPVYTNAIELREGGFYVGSAYAKAVHCTYLAFC